MTGPQIRNPVQFRHGVSHRDRKSAECHRACIHNIIPDIHALLRRQILFPQQGFKPLLLVQNPRIEKVELQLFCPVFVRMGRPAGKNAHLEPRPSGKDDPVPVADMEKFDLFTRSASVADASIGQNSVNIQYNRADAPGFLMQGHESVSLSSEEVRRRPDAGCSLRRRAPSPDSDALP